MAVQQNPTNPVEPGGIVIDGTPPPVMGPEQGAGDPYAPNPDFDEYEMQTGVDGKETYRGNIGVNPDLLNYGEGSKWANKNYNVNATKARAFTRTAGQKEMSAYHLDKMLGSDSPLMRRARMSAMAGAGSRGLMNSSIAQGAAMGSMIDRASPFALQDASTTARAASESLAARNQASQLNAQLGTNASIAGMQAGAQRDSQILGSELGGRQDLLRHMLGTETREDQQAWQERQNEAGYDFQGSQNRLAEQFQWADNRQQAAERWAEGELQLIMNQDMTREQMRAQIASSIFGNPNLTAPEQNAAWASARRILGDNEGGADTGDFGPAPDPGYKLPSQETEPPPLGASVMGAGTSPQVNPQVSKLNQATGQIYKSQSSPSAALITEALPPIL